MYAVCSKASKNSTVAWNAYALILLFSCHHWLDSSLGLLPKTYRLLAFCQ